MTTVREEIEKLERDMLWSRAYQREVLIEGMDIPAGITFTRPDECLMRLLHILDLMEHELASYREGRRKEDSPVGEGQRLDSVEANSSWDTGGS